MGPIWEDGDLMTSPTLEPVEPTSGNDPAPRRRARHLIDPNNPRPAQQRKQMSLTQVQKWVMSILATTTIGHLAAGIVVADVFLSHPKPGARAGLLVIAGIFGMIAVSVGFLIHRRSPFTPWLILGWIPAAVGAWILYH